MLALTNNRPLLLSLLEHNHLRVPTLRRFVTKLLDDALLTHVVVSTEALPSYHYQLKLNLATQRGQLTVGNVPYHGELPLRALLRLLREGRTTLNVVVEPALVAPQRIHPRLLQDHVEALAFEVELHAMVRDFQERELRQRIDDSLSQRDPVNFYLLTTALKQLHTS